MSLLRSAVIAVALVLALSGFFGGFLPASANQNFPSSAAAIVKSRQRHQDTCSRSVNTL